MGDEGAAQGADSTRNGGAAPVATTSGRAGQPDSPSPFRFALIPILFAFAVLATQAYLVIGRNFTNVLETPFLPYCLLGAFSIHMATRPGVGERLWTAGLAV